MIIKVTLICSTRNPEAIKEIREVEDSIDRGEFTSNTLLGYNSWLKDVKVAYDEVADGGLFTSKTTITMEADSPEGIERLMEIKNSVLSGEVQRMNHKDIKTTATFEYIKR